jgi:inosine-uridine nucleoside N-ribohydrolase
VAGNHALELTTLNALRVCSLAGLKNVPVAAGCGAPLMRDLLTAPEIHGEQGLEGYSWPQPSLRPAPEHAVDLIVDLVMSSPAGDLTLVPTGPLTNIAPEAAAIVFAAGWPVTMVGLDVTHAAAATPAVMDRIAAIDSEIARAVLGLLRFYGDRQRRQAGRPDAPVHDAVAVARVALPSLVECAGAHVEVELTGRLTTGMTVTDFRERRGRPFNAQVATRLDFEGFWDLILAAIERL